MTLLTKKEAAEVLFISESTLLRRTRAGIYSCTRTGLAKYAPITYSYEQIGLTEPTPEPAPVDVHVAVQPEPVAARSVQPEPVETFAPRPLSPIEQKEADDRAFAIRYLAGEETDSAGNRIDQKTCSLLGPRDEESSTPAESQAHMSAALLGTNDEQGNPTEAPRHAFENGEGHTRGGTPLCAGLTQEAYDQMMRQWRRSGGGRSEGEQEIASRRGEQNIRRSFPSSPKVKGPTVR